MHELPATQGVLNVALDAARDAGAARVIAIDVVVGELASIVDDSVQFYFDVIARGTPAEGAALRFHREPAGAACGDCGARFAVSPPLRPDCPYCGSWAVTVRGGQDFFVDSIEVDDDRAGGASPPGSAPA